MKSCSRKKAIFSCWEPALWKGVQPLVAGLLASSDVEVRLKLLDMLAARNDTTFLPQVHEKTRVALIAATIVGVAVAGLLVYALQSPA